ncbi:MAG: acetyl-CoA carboxylase biotin carboxyl carrier protein [Bacteroidota bacterium]
MKISEIQELIKFVSKSGVSEVELELKDFKIIIKTPPRKRKINDLQDEQMAIQNQVPVATTQQPQVAIPGQSEEHKPAEGKKEDDESKYVTIKSPMIGTFYRASAPDKPPFVNFGDEIKPGQVICIIEAMKLFNEIECEISGKIVKILVDNTTPVEYDQPLFLVDPH